MTQVKQVGGDHYSGSEYQHWDWADDIQLPYLESAATKYLCRWQKKNGVLDIEKALSYLEKRKVQVIRRERGNNSWHVRDAFSGERNQFALECWEIWVKTSEIPSEEAVLCLQIASWRTYDELSLCIGAVQALLQRAKAGQVVGAGQAPTLPRAAPQGVGFGPCHCGCGGQARKGSYFASDECLAEHTKRNEKD